MFEEVPRKRSGIARVIARRVVLGPFVVGGGVLLAAVGGSVAVAATVITASTIALSDVPPAPRPTSGPVGLNTGTGPAGTASGSHPAGAAGSRPAVAPLVTGSLNRPSVAATPPGSMPTAGQPHRPARVAPITPEPPTSSAPVSAAPPSTLVSSSPTVPPPVLAPTQPSGPQGNALVYIRGYQPSTHRLRYQFADARRASDGSVEYRVASREQFSAGIATSVVVISGGTICPPAGSRCTLKQLITASAHGFFAEAAVDSGGQVRAVLERDSGSVSAAPAQSTAPVPSAPAPVPSASPTAAASSAASAAPSADRTASGPG